MSEEKQEEIQESTPVNEEQHTAEEKVEPIADDAPGLEPKTAEKVTETEELVTETKNEEPELPAVEEKVESVADEAPELAPQTGEKIVGTEEFATEINAENPAQPAVEEKIEITADDAPELAPQTGEKIVGTGEFATEINAEEAAQLAEDEKVEIAPISTTEQKPKTGKKEAESEEVLAEIEEENAEDAEDNDNKHRHAIPILEYHEMSMENLVGELQKLVNNEKVQAIKKHVDGIKHAFDQQFRQFIDGKKEEFIAGGGNEIDFRYNSITKKQFNEVYSEYRDKRNQYYKSLENSLKENLAKRLEIIQELKGLVSVEEDMNTTYNTFKEIQQKWRSAGPIPRNQYNDVWRTYHHHIEMFYDFLHLNRELRDLDFKHNLEEKNKLITRAESLADQNDLGRAFRELQELHKIWKEEIGPVAREIRDEIWERFSNATKVLHARRQEHQKNLEKIYEENLILKNEIINKINGLAENTSKNHKTLQQQIKQIGELREGFFKAGKVPQKLNEIVWKAFKEATRNFNHNKNAFYKSLKKEQQVNLERKRKLVALAVSLKESEEWETATQEFKRIQNDWKKIGHVPRKYSDSIWKEFKNACNHYFDRLHALKNTAQKEEEANFKKKTAALDELKTWAPSGDQKKDLASIKGVVAAWKGYGRVPFKQKHIDQKFNKVLDSLFKKIGMSRQESELLRYGNKIQQLATSQDQEQALSNERQFIRKKIGESKTEILQLENNLQFFKHADDDNPMVKEVRNNIAGHKKSLETWEGKLKKLNIMENNLNKVVEEVEDQVKDEEE